ncbi:MAG TPA: HD domain-containing phosphohydrolase [Gemmatimonadales bacterium]|nr:HD domain-containing phosphohydrolase [Gemmatimonadales bacterium]
MGAAWHVRQPFPGWWAFGAFNVVSILLMGHSTGLRSRAAGSMSFIIFMASALLFGAFWGGCVAAVSSLGTVSRKRSEPIKIVFNISQYTLAITLAVLVYQALGGGLPPAYLGSGAVMSSVLVQRDLGFFFLIAATFFATNYGAVSAAIAFSSGRTFREVWALNTNGVLGYDMGASALAVLIAWLYVRFDLALGFGAAGLLVVILPIMAIRHVYGMYRQLQKSGQELLQLMVKAIEARDPYTSGHSLRVSKLSRTIAAELGVPGKEMEQIESAALLHDVGKIHEEFAPLLRKAEKLTEAEFALLQTHSAKGAELVHIISSFRGKIEAMVRNHHERWDGEGYPDGLAGEDIPLGARIIMVCDTIDAMTTDRPYRKALGVDVVMAELQRCKGTQFDARLVDVVANSVAIRRIIAEATDLPEQAVAATPTPGRSRRIRLSGGETFLSG